MMVIKSTQDGGNNNDFDAHCVEPFPGTHIYFGNRGYRHRSSGMLDVDITRPFSQTPDTMSIKVNIDKMPLPVILKFDGKFTKIKHIKVFQPPLDGWWKERMTEYCFRKTSLL